MGEFPHFIRRQIFLLCQLFHTASNSQTVYIISCILDLFYHFSMQIQSIYQHGGKNFWVHNTGPLGCLPQQLATTATGDSDFDKHGCLNSLNNAAISFN